MFASVHMNQNPIFSKTFEMQEYIDVWPQGNGVHWVTNSCCLPSFSPKFSKVLVSTFGERKRKGTRLRNLEEIIDFQKLTFSIFKLFKLKS